MRIRIDATHPSLPGHFPGNPVVAGALLLAEIEERLAAAGLRIVAVPRARFMRTVAPGDVVEVECRAGSAGEQRFECRVGDEVVVRGSFDVAAHVEGAGEGPGPARTQARTMRMNVDVARLYERLPHSGSMCLIEEVMRWGPDSVCCRARNHRDPANPLRTAGGLRAICVIEYAAQAAALHAILRAENDAPAGKQSRALLALVNGLELETAYLHEGDGDLIVEGNVDYRSGDAVIYRFEVHEGVRSIARGRLGLTS